MVRCELEGRYLQFIQEISGKYHNNLEVINLRHTSTSLMFNVASHKNIFDHNVHLAQLDSLSAPTVTVLVIPKRTVI